MRHKPYSRTPEQQKAINQNNAKIYDFITVTVPKGQKEHIKKFAADNELTTNEFIRRAIKQYMEQEPRA